MDKARTSLVVAIFGASKLNNLNNSTPFLSKKPTTSAKPWLEPKMVAIVALWASASLSIAFSSSKLIAAL